MKALNVYKLLLVIMVVLNAVTIGFLIMKPGHPPMPPDRVNLAETLGMKGEKAKKVEQIQHEHHREMHRLNRQNEQLHRQLYREFLRDTKDTVKASKIVHDIAENHSKVLTLVYAYFSEIRTYCSSEQRIQLNKHIEEVMHHNRPPRHQR